MDPKVSPVFKLQRLTRWLWRYSERNGVKNLSLTSPEISADNTQIGRWHQKMFQLSGLQLFLNDAFVFASVGQRVFIFLLVCCWVFLHSNEAKSALCHWGILKLFIHVFLIFCCRSQQIEPYPMSSDVAWLLLHISQWRWKFLKVLWEDGRPDVFLQSDLKTKVKDPGRTKEEIDLYFFPEGVWSHIRYRWLVQMTNQSFQLWLMLKCWITSRGLSKQWCSDLLRTVGVTGERQGQRSRRARVSGNGSTTKHLMELNRSAANLTPKSPRCWKVSQTFDSSKI